MKRVLVILFSMLMLMSSLVGCRGVKVKPTTLNNGVVEGTLNNSSDDIKTFFVNA